MFFDFILQQCKLARAAYFVHYMISSKSYAAVLFEIKLTHFLVVKFLLLIVSTIYSIYFYE